MHKTDVIIIGAGITGLACAHYLKKKNINFLIVDNKDKIGGVVDSISENGFLYETGPNTGVISNSEVIELLDELQDYIIVEYPNEKAKKRYILKNGKWASLPTNLIDGIKTPLFTWKDKLRLLGEPFRASGTNPNESLADLIRRRMGNSFLDYAVDPFILGIYAGDPNLLASKYAFPKLYNLEQEYGSFIGGAIKKKFSKNKSESKNVTRKIFSIKGGLQSLVEALQKSSKMDSQFLGIQNVFVQKCSDRYLLKGTGSNGHEIKIESKKIISTVPAHKLRNLFPFFSDFHLNNTEKLFYTSVIEVAVGFNKWLGSRPLDGFGGLIPHKENRDILGVLFMSSLFNNRAPENGALLTVFIGGVRRPDLHNIDDNQIKKILKIELMDLFELKEFNPDLLKIMRYEKVIPQYYSDTKERYDSINILQKENDGLILGGNIRDGIGMADRIKQAKQIVLQF